MEAVILKTGSLKNKTALFFQLCSLDMKQRTAGTTTGLLWIYITPLVSISIIWLVFRFGLKVNSDPQGMYSLLVGLMAWQLIVDTVMSGLNSFIEKPYLVKKIKFPLEFLPLIKVTNCFRIHIPFLVIIVFMSVASGNFSVLRAAFFMFFLFPIFYIFLGCLALLLATLMVFVRDIQSVIAVVVQILFWITPIVWTVSTMPRFVRYIEYFNFNFFIINMYRFCFLGESANNLYSSIVFFVFFCVVVIVSFKLFAKLKDQFVDVL